MIHEAFVIEDDIVDVHHHGGLSLMLPTSPIKSQKKKRSEQGTFKV